MPEARVLDLFSGSGALGFEALSRGAAQVVFIEQSRPVAALIEKNARALGVLDQVEIHAESVERFLKKSAEIRPFEIVMADPPYAEGWEEKLLHTTAWEQILTAGGLFVLEWGLKKSQVPSLPELSGPLVKVREKNYGDSVLTHYEMSAPSPL